MILLIGGLGFIGMHTALQLQALHYAGRADLDVVSLRTGSIYGPMYYSMFNAASRCHAAVKKEEPDFRDRPGGVKVENDAQGSPSNFVGLG